jgi:hypothetical protein
MAALERIEVGLSDGIVVATLSRFGRSMADDTVHLARIQRAGGTFISVNEEFDLDTDAGRMMLRAWKNPEHMGARHVDKLYVEARRESHGERAGVVPPQPYQAVPLRA